MTAEDRRQRVSAEPKVETVVTARDGKYTYRVLAYRPLDKDECKKIVWRALRVNYIQEPEPGGEVTLVTTIGRRETDGLAETAPIRLPRKS